MKHSIYFRPYQHLIRWPERLMKFTAWAVIVSYLGVFTVQPVVAAVRIADRAEKELALEQASVTPAERYGNALKQLKEGLRGAVAPAADAARRAESERRIDAAAASLATERTLLDAWWKSQAQWMDAHHFAPEIVARQRKLEQDARAHDGELGTLLGSLRDAPATDRAGARKSLLQFLEREVPDRRANLIDHKNLPWRVVSAKARAPIADAAALRAKLGVGAGKSLGGAHTAQSPSNAALAAPPPPGAADLAATLDAPFSADIRQKASDLGNNPLKIFNWVHDNVRFFPSYGSVQGAQDTLDKLSGNAFDQASLLIAMLRTSGIPARYVYGTIDVPAAKVLNWVGGAQDADAAQQILGQGGIPNVGLTAGGVVTTFRLEHVWVEAYVKNNPGRGAVAGSGDTWLPLDPSFKQYDFTQAMNLQSAAAFDTQGLLDAAQQGATVNTSEGWVQNLNQANVQQRISAYTAQVQGYFNNTNPNATVGDVLGTQTIRALNLALLPASTPYPIQTLAARYSELPDSLRHHFEYQLYSDPNSVGVSDPVMDWTVPTASIAGKKITFAWVAASQNDANAIGSYLPKPHADGSPMQLSEMPTSLPASINVRLEVRVDGSKVADGGSYGLGTALVGVGGFSTYDNLAQYDQTQDSLTAGQQSALGVSIQGLSTRQLNDLQTRLSDARSRLQSQDTSIYGQDDLVTGDMLTSTMWNYLASLQVFGSIAQREMGMIDRPALSYGFFHAVAQPNVLYGLVTTSVSFKGVNLDVGHLRDIRWVKSSGTDSTAAKNQWIAYNKLRGQHASVMENVVPEQGWVDQTQCQHYDVTTGSVVNPGLPACRQGISAESALVIAAQQGQKIFTITQANASVAIPQLQQSSSVIAEVQAAVAAGKTVTIHQKPINASGWSGAGYVETDPATGSGAYLIEGAGNGGFLAVLSAIMVALAVFSFIAPLLAVLLAGLALLIGPALAVGIFALLACLALYISALANMEEGKAQTLIRGLAGLLIGVVVAAVCALLAPEAILAGILIGLVVGLVFLIVDTFLVMLQIQQRERFDLGDDGLLYA